MGGERGRRDARDWHIAVPGLPCLQDAATAVECSCSTPVTRRRRFPSAADASKFDRMLKDTRASETAAYLRESTAQRLIDATDATTVEARGVAFMSPMISSRAKSTAGAVWASPFTCSPFCPGVNDHHGLPMIRKDDVIGGRARRVVWWPKLKFVKALRLREVCASECQRSFVPSAQIGFSAKR